MTELAGDASTCCFSMLTIQILDGAETFFRPLEPRPGGVTLGSSPDADIRLREPGVAPLHARIEPIESSDGEHYKIVDLAAEHDAETKVNGEPVIQWRLSLGDRIELGPAVVVVGKRVTRPATARDVLQPIAPRSRRNTRQPKDNSMRNVVIGALGVGLLICVVVFGFGGSDRLPDYANEIHRHASRGDFDQARRFLSLLRREWVESSEERAARVDPIADSVDALERAVNEGRDRLLEEGVAKRRSEQVAELKAIRDAGPKSIEGRAAHILLSRVDEIRTEISPERIAAYRARQDAARDGTGQPDPVPGNGGGAAADAGHTEDSLAAARAEHERGESQQALARIERALPGAAESVAAELRTLRDQIRSQLENGASLLVARARSLASSNRRKDLNQAIDLLAGRADEYPVGGGGEMIGAELLRLRTELNRAEDSVATIRPGATADEVARILGVDEVLDAARVAQEHGEYRTAKTLLDTLHGELASHGVEATGEIQRLSGDVALLAALEGHLATAAADAELRLDRREGGDQAALVTDASGRLRDASGTPPQWSEIAPSALHVFLGSSDASPEAVLGAAVLAYSSGDRKQAEEMLRPLALKKSVESVLHGVIARGRGDVLVDDRGYRLVKGEFISVREIEQRKAAELIEKRIAAALRRDAAARAAVLEEILGEGPEVLDTTVFALRRQLTELVGEVESHRFKRSWEKVAGLRAELDRRREYALELIFDEKKYFYPFRPPAVSGTLAAEYNRVQNEIDQRVASVRELWEREDKPRRVPRPLLDTIERIDWIANALRDFGETADTALERIEWVRTLPADGKLSLRNFCYTKAERTQLDLYERVLALNAVIAAPLPRAESELQQITNDYRILLGRRPLALNAKLVIAAREHAQEMSKLGYFSHFSPTPGRKSPYDRMRNAGYNAGVAENIAKHPSGQSAHNGWCHSSGHHRNMLMSGHTEFAAGNDGNLWVEVFGSGSEYREHEKF